MARLRARAYLAGADRLVDKYVRGFGRPDILHAQATLWGGVAAIAHQSVGLASPS